ncbi:hypothetical protein C8R34_1832 [Nitrosomonas sp. Nm84]|nr:hypothetical protein C8R34_1832 [Nitrosomonas sp. Nm84]
MPFRNFSLWIQQNFRGCAEVFWMEYKLEAVRLVHGGKCGINGIDAIEGRACKSEEGARHCKKSDGVLYAGISVKYAWIERHKTCWPVSRQCEVLNVSTKQLGYQSG